MPDEKAGTYCISVTNWSGHCTGIGTPFQLVYPQEFKEYTFGPNVKNCYVCLGKNNYKSPMLGEDYYSSPHCSGGQAEVWYLFFYNNTEGDNVYANFVGRSKLSPNNQYWYKDKGHILSAKMTIERKSKLQTVEKDTSHPCLGGVVVLDSDFPCEGLYESGYVITPNAGTKIPINTSQGDAWEVDLSNAYLPRFQQNKPDYGLILYPALDYYTCPDDWCNVGDGECYKVIMTFRFAKDIT